MIYFVSKNKMLFEGDISYISLEEALNIISTWNRIQVDTETDGKDCHINNLLLLQLGNKKAGIEIVIDATSIDIQLFKSVLESKLLILQNAKFDLKFLYNYNIIPNRIYDTMIVEQLLHLGWPKGSISYSLQSIAERRCHIFLDKTVRGEIIWRGIDEKVIKYAANDVVYLEDILESQVKDLHKQNLINAAVLENNFVPVLAYLEWCGIKIDEDKWRSKIKKDKEELIQKETALNDFLLKLSQKGFIDIPKEKFQRWVYVDTQGDLFNGYNLDPQVSLKWSSSSQVVELARLLGFNTTIQDKETGEDKESVLEKFLLKQKGICDEFLTLYFDYQEVRKRCTTYGQSYLNAINPNTGRVHSEFRQLGTSSGRIACGSKQVNSDLAKLKGLPQQKQNKVELHCGYPQLQNLPADEETRSCFVSEPDNLFCSCDYSAIESRLGADIYNEQSMKDEFLYRSGDMHSLCAYLIYTDEIPRDTSIHDIKKLYPKLRREVKGIEFSQQFGGSEFAIQNSLGCSIEKAREFKVAYEKAFPGIAAFKKKGSKEVREKGYIVMCKETGHKMYWYKHEEWLKTQQLFTPDFWEEYKLKHKGTGDSIAKMVSEHSKEGAYWDRLALNSVTQGTGAICLKQSGIDFFKWIVDNGYFGKVLLCDLVHDEICIEFPKEHPEIADILKRIMEKAASLYCKSLPIPAEPETSIYWRH